MSKNRSTQPYQSDNKWWLKYLTKEALTDVTVFLLHMLQFVSNNAEQDGPILLASIFNCFRSVIL